MFLKTQHLQNLYTCHLSFTPSALHFFVPLFSRLICFIFPYFVSVFFIFIFYFCSKRRERETIHSTVSWFVSWSFKIYTGIFRFEYPEQTEEEKKHGNSKRIVFDARWNQTKIEREWSCHAKKKTALVNRKGATLIHTCIGDHRSSED